MRTRLFLSAAAATLSLCLCQANAQNIPQNPAGGEASKQGESIKPAKPAEQGASQQRGERRDERAQEQKHERGAQQSAETAGRPGGVDKETDKRGETARGEDNKADRQGAAQAKKEENKAARDAAKAAAKQDKAARKEEKKSERHGAGNIERDRGSAARGERGIDRHGAAAERQGLPAEKQGAAKRGEHYGSAAKDAERRAAQPDAERAGPADERGRVGDRPDAQRRGEMEPGARTQERGAMDNRPDTTRGAADNRPDATRGPEVSPRGGAAGRDRFGSADRGDGRDRVQLTERQQSQLRQIIGRQNVQTISPNVFSPRIGAVLPSSVQFYPLPPDVISFLPQYQGFGYVMVGEDIAIIDPGDREVVTVLDEGGGPPSARYGYGYDDERDGARSGRYEGREGRYGTARRDEDRSYRGGRERRGEAYGYAPRVRLDTRQERALYRGVIHEAGANLRQVCVRVGERAPESVDLAPVPRTIAAEAPDAARFDYFVLNDQVVLVDPDTRIVVDIIPEPK